jgi:hypothetical protein
LQKTDDAKTAKRALSGAGLKQIRAEMWAEFAAQDPERARGRLASYTHALQSGHTSAILHVIEAAHQDKLANEAVRMHIADLIDQGRDDELTTQLRAYAVKYLCNPMDIMRQRNGD